MCIERGGVAPAPRQGCNAFVVLDGLARHRHLAPLTGCAFGISLHYTHCPPDGGPKTGKKDCATRHHPKPPGRQSFEIAIPVLFLTDLLVIGEQN